MNPDERKNSSNGDYNPPERQASNRRAKSALILTPRSASFKACAACYSQEQSGDTHSSGEDQGARLGGRSMRTTDPLQSQASFDDDPPTQPLVPGESFGPGFGVARDETDAWLGQASPTRVVDSQPPGGSSPPAVYNGASGKPPRRGGPRVSR